MKKILGITVYDVAEVAAMLDVTNTTITNYIRRGAIDARMLGGKWHISEQALKNFVSGGGNENYDSRNK